MKEQESGAQAHHCVKLPSGKTVYIVKKGGGAADVQGVWQTGCVFVLDDRHTGNPSFQIKESYRITSARHKREILQAILDYDAKTPSDPPWNRSMDSLVKEWNLHNLAYRLHVYRRSSRDVDLDNRDEGKGYAHFFIVAVQRVWERVCARVRKPGRRSGRTQSS